MTWRAAGAAIWLTGCARGQTPPPAPPPVVTIADPSAFLVTSLCPDGMPSVIEGCANPSPQKASDQLLTRRHDFEGPTVGNYLDADAFATDDGAHWVTTWSFTPYGPFTASNGDGGEVYVLDGPIVRISGTQDGSADYVQGFYGAGCGGQGWVLFKTDAPTGQYASLVTNLYDEEIPSPCSAQDQSLVNYRLEQVNIPLFVNDVSMPKTLPTVISEHYSGKSVDFASEMERSFFAEGIGRVGWEYWNITPTTPTQDADVAQRCPLTLWSTAPISEVSGTRWYFHNCSWPVFWFMTDGAMTGDSWGWPPGATQWP